MLGIEKNEVEIKGGIEVFSYEALEILKEIVKKKKNGHTYFCQESKG